jgi:hypothetical protein
MSLSNMLFGDFSVSYTTDLPVAEAVGRLSAATDQLRPVERRGLSTLCGYATTHEVVLWRETANQLAPFQPIFRGRFVAHGGATRLEGSIRTGWLIKLWLSAPLFMAALLGAIAASGGTVHVEGSAVGWYLAPVVFGLVYLFLRLMIRPGSMLVFPLEQAILFAIASRGPNNSSKPTPLRGAA